MKLESLAGKVAVITGGASGIGAAAAKMMAESGAKLTIVDYNQGWLDETAGSIEGLGQEVLPIRADVAQAGVADMAVAETVKKYGRIDIGVNLAGIAGQRPIIEMTDDEWNRMLGIHLYGTFSFCRAYAREMARQGKGVIVNCSSVRAYSGLANASHYTAAKAGIIGLTYAMAIELVSKGIRVNAVAPAGTATNLGLLQGQTPEQVAAARAHPAPTIMTAEQVARTVVFLASDDSDMLNGQVVGVTRYRGDNTGGEVAPRDHLRLT